MFGDNFVMLDRLITFICEEIGTEDVSEGTVIGELIDDEIEAQELISAVENEFSAELDCGSDITVGKLAEMLEGN